MSSKSSAEDILQKALQKKQEAGLFRTLPISDGLIDFCSNDYLGLARHELLNAAVNTVSAGATGSRLISGNSLHAEDTEALIAAYHKAEAALVFNTGYMANVGLFSAIGDKNTTFLYDEHIHASVIDGMRLSLAKRYKFRHNDLDDLRKKLDRTTGLVYVAVESVYSMDGDMAPLEAITALCKQYGAALIVDEAHATGIYGDKGEGLVSALQLEDAVFARVHTFGKALGHHGAAVTGSNTLRQFLVNHARAFIYTTALPPHSYTSIQQAYQLLPGANRKALFENISCFRNEAQLHSKLPLGFLVNESPIQAIMIPGNTQAKALAEHLKQSGYFVKAILSPTVSEGTERIRICLHSFNSEAEIKQLFHALSTYTI